MISSMDLEAVLKTYHVTPRRFAEIAGISESLLSMVRSGNRTATEKTQKLIESAIRKLMHDQWCARAEDYLRVNAAQETRGIKLSRRQRELSDQVAAATLPNVTDNFVAIGEVADEA